MSATSLFLSYALVIHLGGHKRTFRDCQSRAPLISQYVQADTAVAVDVRVVDAGGEVDFRWLERVVCWEVDREEEDAAGIW